MSDTAMGSSTARSTAGSTGGRTAGGTAVAARAPARPLSAWAGVAIIAAAAFAAEMAVSARYGYHRDELYFLAAGQHPAFGYVDQPPLTPLTARLSAALTGNSLAGLRLLPAAGLAALIGLTAAMSRLLGAGRTGQVLAALAAATCGEYLAAMHMLTTTTLDFVCWALVLYLVMRLLDSGDARWWLAIGAAAGIASEAKWTIAFLAGSLAAGFLVTPARALARSWYLLAGLGIAALLAAPDVAWQAAHGWPQLAVFRALQGAAGHNRAVYWPAQVVYTGLYLTPGWVAGLAWSLRNQAARRFRPVAIASAAALLVIFALGGKPYYAGAVYTFLFAAGGAAVERWLTARGNAGQAGTGRIRIRIPAGILAGLAVSAALSIPVALPVLPARALHTIPLQEINYDMAETIAWPRLVHLVGREYDALPAAQRRDTAILTGNYGEAGAIARYGPGIGLPQAYSGANNFWYWGPPPARDSSVLAVNVGPALLRREFTHVRQVATFYNGIGVSDDEQGTRIYLATGLRASWADAWPAFRDFS